MDERKLSRNVSPMAVRPRTRHRRASEPQERSPKLPLWKVRPWMAVVEWHGPRSNISHRGRFAQPSGMMAKKWSRPVSRVLCALRRDSHSSRPSVTAWLKQPTRERRGPRHRSPIWSCSGWGLPCRSVARLAVGSYPTVSPLPRSCHPSAALQPLEYGLGRRPLRVRRQSSRCKSDRRVTGSFGGLLSVALSVGSRRPGVTWHPALRSPDFPRHSEE